MEIIEKLKNLKQKFFSFFSQVVGRSFSGNKEETAREGEEEEHLNEEKKKTASQIFVRQALITVGGGVFILICGFVFLKIGPSKGKVEKQKEEIAKKKIKVEVASEALDPDLMWRNHFEEKLHSAENTTSEQLTKIESSFQVKSAALLDETQGEMKELKEQLLIAKHALEEATDHLREARNKEKESDNKAFENIIEASLQSAVIEDEMDITSPKDSKLYIPETGYITGTLLGGIAVSTSVGSSSEPVPVVIRITGRGNLPKNFKVDLSTCRILGSSYGDLSSERAVIRVETMICENKKSEEIITTKIAGLAYGDDGMNGIKGRVVDMSTKHIKNAAIGGMLSGFAGTMKSEGQFTLSSIGAVNTKDPGVGSKLRDNTLTGMGNAAEKIADYYIRQAENMSPVLLIPGGARVDIVFTKGIYLGSTGIVKVIEEERKKSANASQ